MKSLKGKIISSAVSIAAIVTLIAFGISSSAWFSSNRVTTANGISMKTIGEDIEVDSSYVIYSYKDPKRSVGSTTNGVNVELGKYSFYTTSILTTNGDCMKFVRFKLKFPHGYAGKSSISMRLTSTQEFKNSDGKVTDGISNLISLSFLDNYGEGKIPADSATSTDDYYALCKAKFESSSITKHQFVTGSGTSFSKNKQISFTVNMPCFAVAGNTSDFIMKIDYVEDIMTYYKDNSTHSISTQIAESTIDFIKDISRIEFIL